MIIIDVCGGLGNQMFQYALYCELLAMGKDVRLSLRHFEDVENGKWKNVPVHGQKFLLQEIFPLQAQIATRQEAAKLGSIGTDPISRVVKKIGLKKKSHITEEMLKPVTKEKLLSLDNVFLEGYWQDFSLFGDAHDLIRTQFTFSSPLTGKNFEVARQMEAEQSVSIHVRRGDYLNSTMYEKLDKNYYLNSIKYINEHICSAVFYCFSDDIEWCKEAFKEYDVTYINWNCGASSNIDMQLMSLCKHNIVANSSFSVWAAWLNSNKDKIVIRSQKYYAKEGCTYPWPKEWCVEETWNNGEKKA